MNLHFTSFRTRLLVVIVGLLITVLTVTYMAINRANINNATLVISEQLEAGATAFRKLINERSEGLKVVARLLSADWAFKETYRARDRATLVSAMHNYLENRAAIPDAVMITATLDGTIIADTVHPDNEGKPIPWPQLIRAAEKDEWLEAATEVLLDGKPYQMTIVPLLTPEPDAWILTGFPIDQSFAEEIKGINLSEISVVHATASEKWHLDASTLPSPVAEQLPQLLDSNRLTRGKSLRLELGETAYVSLLTPIIDEGGTRIVAVLQRSLEDQLRPFKRLEYTLFILFTLGLFASFVGAALVARGVTRPVLKLTEGARRIEEGDFHTKVEIPQQDEIGTLADSFNNMARGLAEKEKVRNLLGKVVSPEIAEELLSKDIELGGEERQASILFSDVRNFTALCEGKSPSIILDLLNRYLTRISTVIEENGGVVDKYIGDAVMALFGAPLQHDDDPDRAVQTALGMCEALEELNQEFAAQGLAEIGIGVGINTGLVVAGNMGSINRLNYTVIGDSVNLASRLEGLTKQYGVLVIVSESTMAASRNFVFRELDCVRVKGKLQPVSIYEPLARKDRIPPETLQELEDYHNGLKLYRSREWQLAIETFGSLADLRPACRLYQLYLERARHFQRQPPDQDWDGSCTYTQK